MIDHIHNENIREELGVRDINPVIKTIATNS
jgi:hypothetical protein